MPTAPNAINNTIDTLVWTHTTVGVRRKNSSRYSNWRSEVETLIKGNGWLWKNIMNRVCIPGRQACIQRIHGCSLLHFPEGHVLWWSCMLDGPRSCMPELARNPTILYIATCPPCHAFLSYATSCSYSCSCFCSLPGPHTPVLSTTIDSIA